MSWLEIIAELRNSNNTIYKYWNYEHRPLLHVNKNSLIWNLEYQYLSKKRSCVYKAINTYQQTSWLPVSVNIKRENPIIYEANFIQCRVLWELDNLSPFFYYELLFLVIVCMRHVYVHVYMHVCVCPVAINTNHVKWIHSNWLNKMYRFSVCFSGTFLLTTDGGMADKENNSNAVFIAICSLVVSKMEFIPCSGKLWRQKTLVNLHQSLTLQKFTATYR